MLPRPLFGMYKVSYTLKEEPKISILIPNMDHIDLLDQCIDSLYKLNTYRNFEVIIIENNSQKQETFDYYKKLVMSIRILKSWNGMDLSTTPQSIIMERNLLKENISYY